MSKNFLQLTIINWQLETADVKIANLLTLRQHQILFKELLPIVFCQLNVEDIGFEPMTPCVQGRCSSQLS